jgi:hypothetical protein
MVTSNEIEDEIAKLHKEHRTSREISKCIHKNYTYIGAVLRKRFPEEYADNSTISKETEALKLFSEKKSPTEVAIKLEWNFDQTEKVYLDYLRLERLYELYIIYKEQKQNLREFLWFYKRLMARKVTPKYYKEILQILDTNKRLDEEMAYFDTKFLNGEQPSGRNKKMLYPD